MRQVLFFIGRTPIYSYSVIGILALIAMITVAFLRLKPRGYRFNSVLTLAFWGVLFGLLGARAFYVAGHARDFSHNLGQIITLQMSGLVLYGAVLFGGLAVFLSARVMRMDLREVADAVGLAFPLGVAFGRLGCFLNGCCVGKPSGLPWAVRFPGAVTTVHPTQLYEILLDLAAFGLLLFVSRRRIRHGELFLLSLALYAAVRFFTEFFRAHSSGYATYVFQAISLAIFLACLVTLAAGRRRQPSIPFGEGARLPEGITTVGGCGN